jgi:hypothetical protein
VTSTPFGNARPSGFVLMRSPVVVRVAPINCTTVSWSTSGRPRQFSVRGILANAVVSPHAPVPNLTVDVSGPGTALDQLGQRIRGSAQHVVSSRCAPAGTGEIVIQPQLAPAVAGRDQSARPAPHQVKSAAAEPQRHALAHPASHGNNDARMEERVRKEFDTINQLGEDLQERVLFLEAVDGVEPLTERDLRPAYKCQLCDNIVENAEP